jgi:hypothetical protein
MKWFLCALIVAGVVFAYILMAALQPMTNDIIDTVNATANWTNFEETQNAINSYPLYSWLIPGFVGVVAIVILLRSPDS